MEISANTQALAYPVSAILFILALKGLTPPDDGAARQLLRHGRHGASPLPPR